MDKYQHRAVANLLEALETFTTEERKQVMDVVAETYCLRCMEKHDRYRTCYCEADE